MKISATRANTDEAATPAASKDIALTDNRSVVMAQRQMQITAPGK